MSAGGHTPLDGFGLGDVDHGVEEKRFAMLTSEILGNIQSRLAWWGDDDHWTIGKREKAYPAHNIIIIRKMRLACFASKDLARIEVDIVCQTHDGWPPGSTPFFSMPTNVPGSR